MDIELVLRDFYRPAVNAHLEYEVFAGVRNKKAIVEFEAALSHFATAISEKQVSELDHFKSHCNRVSVETTEFIAESYFQTLRSRVDPYYKHPRWARFMLLTKPAIVSESYEKLKEMQGFIIEGRKYKGHDHSIQDSLSSFQKAVDIGKGLDKIVPFCGFGERLFAIILLILGLAMGQLSHIFS